MKQLAKVVVLSCLIWITMVVIRYFLYRSAVYPAEGLFLSLPWYVAYTTLLWIGIIAKYATLISIVIIVCAFIIQICVRISNAKSKK